LAYLCQSSKQVAKETYLIGKRDLYRGKRDLGSWAYLVRQFIRVILSSPQRSSLTMHIFSNSSGALEQLIEGCLVQDLGFRHIFSNSSGALEQLIEGCLVQDLGFRHILSISSGALEQLIEGCLRVPLCQKRPTNRATQDKRDLFGCIAVPLAPRSLSTQGSEPTRF